VFSRSDEEERRGPVDVRGVLESSARMASNEIRHRARLVKDYGDAPPAHANEARLGQVFLNLLINAAQAIPEGRAEANEIGIATRSDAAGNVVVEIRDTGSGIPPDVLPRIFDPFFTTKPVGVGTGLGLAICHRIIVSLGGSISVDTRPGKGTQFRITLPRAGAQAAPAAKAAGAEAAQGRRGRVLVIDDEPALCTMIQRILASQHEVVAITRAREALRVLGEGGRFDAILCDLMMPEMTGMELHAELSRLDPEQAGRVIFMTGGAFTQNARTFLDQVKNPTVEKPFTAATLRGAVRGLLA
jgi:CheY-like chemotaxis protein